MKLDEPDLAELIRTKFVAVAVYHAAAVSRGDAEGDLYRRLRDDPRFTVKQPNAAVCFDANGTILGFANDPTGGVNSMVESVARDFRPPPLRTADLSSFKLSPTTLPWRVGSPIPEACVPDSKWAPRPPAGGLVLQANSKNLDAPPPTRHSQGIGRNSLWLRKDECEALAAGTLPESFKMRLARFNVWENSKGRAGIWRPEEVRDLKMTLKDGRLSGTILLGTPDAARGKWFRGALLGFIESKDRQITRFDLVIRGEGRVNNGDDNAPVMHAAMALRIADAKDPAYDVPPSGWLTVHEDYFR